MIIRPRDLKNFVLPKAMRIGNRTLKIRRVKTTSDRHGDIDLTRGTIEISTDLSPEQQYYVLKHERMHFILRSAGLHNLLTLEQEEAICDAYESLG